MFPHANIHRRRSHHVLVGGQQHGGGQVVADALRHFRQNICGRRRDEHQIGIARKLDMSHLGFVGQGKQISIDLVLA